MRSSRLLVVNCNVSESITEIIDSAARAAVGSATEVVTIAPTWGVASAEGYLDGHLAAVAMLDAVRHYERPYDAVVLAGFGEPGREAFRELLDVPVVDITDAGAHLDEPDVLALLDELNRDSDVFAHWWTRHAVVEREGGLREFQHPRRGPLAYRQTTFRLATHPDLKLVMLLEGA